MTKTELEIIQPDGWARPSGYSNGVVAPSGARMLFVAGQIAWDAEQRLVSSEFAPQFRQALFNVLAVVGKAGGDARHVCNLTIFVTDRRAYLRDVVAVGVAYREILGRHFPAMALVQVAGLLEEGALVEIQAVAALPA